MGCTSGCAGSAVGAMSGVRTDVAPSSTSGMGSSIGFSGAGIGGIGAIGG